MARAAKIEAPEEPEQTTLEAIKGELSKLTAVELSSLIKYAQEGFETKRNQAKRELIARVREEAEALQIDVSELFPVSPAQASKAPPARGVRKGSTVADKYRSPDGKQTWTGRGRSPTWMAELEAAGKSRDEFLIEQAPQLPIGQAA